MNFEHQLVKLKEVEGFYSDDGVDRGGETVYGISRRRWPGWAGWSFVDELKKAGQLETLKQSKSFNNLVHEFYLANFWLPCGAMVTPEGISRLLFDAAVNHGVEQSVVFLQQALNALNDRQTKWKDLVEDGDLGPKTQSALKTCLYVYEQDLMWSLITIRGAFYYGLARRSESQEKFFRGWMKRVRELYSSLTKESK